MKNGQAITRGRHGLAAVRATVLAVGVALVWGAVGIWASTVRFASSPMPRTESVNFYLSGDPLIVSRSNTNYSDAEYRELNGSPADPTGRTAVNPGNLQGLATPRRWFESSRLWNERLAGAVDTGKTPTAWYAIQPTGDARGYYLEGFDIESKRRVGYLGRNGVQSATPPRNEWFDAGGQPLSQRLTSDGYIVPGRYASPGYGSPQRIFLLDGDSILEIDLRSRRLAEVGSLSGAFSLSSVAWYEEVGGNLSEETRFGEAGRKPDGTSYYLIVARSEDALAFIDPLTSASREFTLPDEFLAASSFSAVWQGEEQLILQTSRGNRLAADLAWITPDGQITRRESLQLAGYGEPNLSQGSWAALAVAPAPILAPVVVGVTSYAQVNQGRAESFDAAVRQVVSETTPALIAAALLGVASAAWIAHRHRANYRGGVWLWPLLGLLIGPAGAVGYALHWKRPPRVKCHECDRHVPRNRDACPACQAEWPAPAPLGIEIIA